MARTELCLLCVMSHYRKMLKVCIQFYQMDNFYISNGCNSFDIVCLSVCVSA